MTALLSDDLEVRFASAGDVLPAIGDRLLAGDLVPYLGPGVIAGTTAVPTSPGALASFLGSKVALPARARGNAWAAAQFIESTRHRNTVTALMAEAFAMRVTPTPLHRLLASLSLPLIVDVWYDGAMRAALADRGDWGEIQGITRSGIAEGRWYRCYDRGGEETGLDAARGWKTLLYKPHGAVDPARNFLISDADYVEVLTEIDIQTPIPEIVRERRTERGFLFLGCRFDDQLLRTYARQIMKRSAGPHYLLLDAGEEVTRNEIRFLSAQDIVPVVAPVERIVEGLEAAA